MSEKIKKKAKPGPELIRPDYAAIDIGSNNLRVYFYRVNDKGEVIPFKIDEQTTYTCALGVGMSEGEVPVLLERNLYMAEAALRNIAALMMHYGIRTDSACYSAVATAALRAVEGSWQGDDDILLLRKAFHPYTFDIISQQEEEDLVFEAAQSDPIYRFTMSMIPQDPNNKAPYAFIFNEGGASGEVIVTDRNGAALAQATIFQGIHTVNTVYKASGSNIRKAAQAVTHSLQQTQLPANLTIGFAMGGAFRALRKDTCVSGGFDLNGQKLIRAKLTETQNRPLGYFKGHAEEPVRDRAATMALGAMILEQTVDYFGADRVIFLKRKLVDALVLRVHTENVRRSQLSSQPLSAPSGPAQPLPV